VISIARHTIAFGRVFTFAFLFVSSGFTIISHICSTETCECCDTSGACDEDACANKQLPLPVACMSIHNVDDCHINAVDGGFAVVQALVEKDIETQNVEVLSFLTSTFVLPAPSNTSSLFNYSYL
jgi:flavoprotein